MPKFLDSLNVEGAATISGDVEATTQVLKLAEGQSTPFIEFEASDGTVLASVNADGTPGGALVQSGSGSGLMNYQAFTSSGTFAIPVDVQGGYMRHRGIGGGGGGGGGGSAASGGSSLGGGGGGAGMVVDEVVQLDPADTSLILTMGAGGSGGSGLASGQASGNTYGALGGTTTIVGGQSGKIYISANGGGRGGSNVSYFGLYGDASLGQALAANNAAPGDGGGGSPSAGRAGYDSGGVMACVVGGAGGGGANATLGGSGGGAQQAANPLSAQIGGAVASQPTIVGEVGQTATQPGCGGGGGGGSANGAAGAAGGDGAPGQCELWW